MGEAQLRRKDREAGQVNLFDLMGGEPDPEDQPGSANDFSSNPKLPEVPEMDELEKLKLEKELLGFFLSGHPVDTLSGLGPLLDTIDADQLDNLEGRRSFRLCGVLADLERRYTKKDAKPWARFTLMSKAKDFSLPMFTEAYEQYGGKLEEGAMVVIEGEASHRDGETRMSVKSVLPVDQALVKLVDEVPWVLDPDDEEAESFARDIFKLSDQGIGNTLIRLGFAREGEEDGLVVETDARFKVRMTSQTFREWRERKSVRGARVKLLEPEPPEERKYGRR
jgi:DNA polymerase-3 subunit alpha